MKIAILSPFYPYRGGMAQFSSRLYEELSITNEVKAFNYLVLYPSFLFPGKTQYVEESDGVSVVNSDRILNTMNPISFYSTAQKINSYSPDILIVPYWMSFLAPILGSVCLLLDKNIKIVGLIHNAIPHEKRFFDKSFANFFFSRCDAFISLSDGVLSDIQSIVPNKQMYLHPHPIYDHYGSKIDPTQAKLKLGLNIDKKTLLFFGLIREYKGLDLLIEAMSYLNDEYQLLIAGECYGDFSKYQTLIDKNLNKDNIKIKEEYIPDDLVSTLFSAADVLVLPYRDATQSGVVAVAYQLETPMIGTNVGALGKTIKESQVGLVSEDLSPKSIANSIIKFFEDPKLEACFKQHIQLEKTKLSWSSFVKGLDAFFKSL